MKMCSHNINAFITNISSELNIIGWLASHFQVTERYTIKGMDRCCRQSVRVLSLGGLEENVEKLETQRTKNQT